MKFIIFVRINICVVVKIIFLERWMDAKAILRIADTTNWQILIRCWSLKAPVDFSNAILIILKFQDESIVTRKRFDCPSGFSIDHCLNLYLHYSNLHFLNVGPSFKWSLLSYSINFFWSWCRDLQSIIM